MPSKITLKRARADRRAGKRPTTQAGGLCARRYTTYVKASTVQGQPNRQSRSPCRKPAGQASLCLRLEEAGHLNALERAPHVRTELVRAIGGGSLPQPARVPPPAL